MTIEPVMRRAFVASHPRTHWYNLCSRVEAYLIVPGMRDVTAAS